MATIEQIEKLARYSEPPLKGAMCDLLWADPLLEGILGYKLSDKEYQEVLCCMCCYGVLSLSTKGVMFVC